MEKAYKKLLVWQKADALAVQIYRETKKFPKEELFGITAQLRRAVLSVAVNLVEGTGRQRGNELKQFVNIALGSLAETEYLLDFCCAAGLLAKEKYESLEKIRKETGALLWGFYRNL